MASRDVRTSTWPTCIKDLARKNPTDDDQEKKNDDTDEARNERVEERKPNGSDLRTSEPLCSLIKPGVARLGGVCAVAGGVRVAPRWSNREAEGMEGGRGPGDRGRLHRGGVSGGWNALRGWRTGG